MTSVDVGKSTIASDDSQPTIIGDTYYQSAFSGDGTYAASAEFSIDLSTETNGNFSKREGDMIISEVSSAILASSFTNRKSETVENLTVNKLRYSSLGLHGRDKEKEILNTCLVNVAAKDNNIKRAMVFIKGFSGTGKSALSESMMARTKSLNGLYIKGKFDLHLRDEPYSGIAAACRGICGDILMLRDHPVQEGSSTGRSFQEIHDKLIDGLGAEIHLLTKVIPELSEIVGDQQTRSETEGATEHHGNQQEAEARFNYIFRGFIRVITSYFAPLVMVLDDLQWADVGSLELMDVLITDRDTSNFMIIGLYRSNEVDDYHIMSKILRDLKEKSKEEDFDISEIELGNLGVDEVNCVIMDLLSLDDSSKAIGLAEICHKRTLGNAFFLIAFIAMLREEGLLDFNLGLFKWVWDVTKIESETGASSNVVDLMKRKMTKSPADFCQLLSMAACLGSSFDVAKLGLVWNDHCQHSKRNIQHDDDNTMLEHWLSLAIEEGYLDRCGACDYQWSHDKVQEAAFSLVSAEKLGDFKFRVGDILLQQLSEKECDDSIFVVVNLLYEGSASALEDLKRIRLAELHLQASQKAAIFSAFSSSAKFARRGIDLLPGDRWTNHCELTLDLFSTAAESYGYLGNVDSMESFCNEVLKQDIPLLDKLRVYNVLVSSMTNSGRHAEAAVLILEILRQLGCKFPKSSASRSLATLASLAKARATLNSRTPEEIAKMPTIKDSLQIETMKLLGKLATCSHLCGSNLALLPIMRKIRLTLRYGLCEVSPPAFAALGAIMSGVLGDLQAGSRIGDYSLLLLAKVKSKHTFSRTTLILFRYVFSSTRPFRSLFKSFLEGYGNGLTSGDNESALLCIASYIALSFLSGRSLKLLEADCSIYSKQMKEFKILAAFEHTLIFWQSALNLMGRSENTSLLQGEAVIDSEEFLNHNSPPLVILMQAQQSRMYAIFGEHKKGADLSITNGYALKILDPSFKAAFLFCGGISSFEMARKTKKRKYKKHAKKIHSTIKYWVRKGNPNVIHYDRLLDAEKAALDGKSKAAQTLYQKAVALAARGGFVHDAALANERYGEFLLHDMSDKQEAVYRFEEAIKFYSEWGASKKVELIREQYSDLWQRPTEIS